MELHVPNFSAAKDYYGKMGFEIQWEQPPDGHKGYLVMELEGNLVAFWCGNESVYEHSFFRRYPKETPKGFGVELVFMVPDVEGYYEKVRPFANVVEELHIQPWGLKDFRTEDPYGFYLRFSEPDDISKPQPAI